MKRALLAAGFWRLRRLAAGLGARALPAERQTAWLYGHRAKIEDPLHHEEQLRGPEVLSAADVRRGCDL